MFWKLVRPFLTDKVTSKSIIVLLENNKLIAQDKELLDHFSQFFENAVKNLDIKEHI